MSSFATSYRPLESTNVRLKQASVAATLFLSMLFTIIAMATHAWVQYSIAGVDTGVGLKEMWIRGMQGGTSVQSLNGDEAKAGKAALTCGIIALILAVIGFAFAVVRSTGKSDHPSAKRIIALLSLNSSLFLFFGSVLYSAIFPSFPDGYHYGYSFGLFILAGFLGFGGTCLQYWLVGIDA